MVRSNCRFRSVCKGSGTVATRMCMSLGSKPDPGLVCSVAPRRNWRARTASSPWEAGVLPICCSANAEQVVAPDWRPSGGTTCVRLELVAVGGAAGVTANRDPAARAATRTKVPTPRFINPPLQRTIGFPSLHAGARLHRSVATGGNGAQFAMNIQAWIGHRSCMLMVERLHTAQVHSGGLNILS